MAIAFDSSSIGATNGYSWSHTCAGSNLIVIVYIIGLDCNPNSATYNGVSMTLIPNYGGWGSAPIYDIKSYYIINPPTGTNTISISCSGGVSWKGFAVSYTGVNQTTPIDSNAVNWGTYTTDAISDTVVNNNCVMVGMGTAVYTASNSVTCSYFPNNRINSSYATYAVTGVWDSIGNTVSTGTNTINFVSNPTSGLIGLSIALQPSIQSTNSSFFAFF